MQDPHPFNDARELAEELEKYRQIVENAGDAVVSINASHEVVYLNAAAERMFGYARAEVLGGGLGPLVPPEHRAAHRHYLERYLAGGQPRLLGHAAQLEAERRDGTRFPISISFSLAQTSGGPLFTAIMRDLSAEHDLVERARRAERLAAVGQMVTTVSHEIRTPLALIGGFARQVLRDGAALPANSRRKLGIIVDEVARLEGMLAELNDLARPQQYNWREVDLAELVSRVRELMAPELRERGLELAAWPAPGLPRVVADPDKLSQVLINLVQNAAQASPAGGRVELGLDLDALGQVVLVVADQGPGIAPELRERIFQPFYTTKNRGTGLGLPVARRIVEEHGGRISVEGREGAGALFRVVLPPLAGAGRAQTPARA